MKKLFLSVCFLFCLHITYAQYSRYIVQFKDKNNNSFSISNPSEFITQRALQRRSRYAINIDSSDLPVSSIYLNQLQSLNNLTILNISKWLNQVSITITDTFAINQINQLGFVQSISPIASKQEIISKKFSKNKDELTAINKNYTSQNVNDYYNYGLSSAQVKIHKGDFLHNHGFRGEQMQMAILDAGFYHYDLLPTFDSIRLNNQILGTWDFVDNETSVSEDYNHGMHCLSAISANLPGRFIGTAPKTSFYLFRTEDAFTEYPIEEHNLVVAAERADSLGVDVCSISLGYTEFDDPVFNHTYQEMNGRTTMSAKAMNIASRKGMLMVAAAGNEGATSWHYISTPADADSAFAIGAVDTLGRVASFSSYGPSSDGDIKPNVAAVGSRAVVANDTDGSPTYGSGTSYACPNMAGITTCLWQAFPEASNMTIIDELQKSASKYSNPDNRIGYGIPNAKKAFVSLQKKYFQHEAAFNNCKNHLNLLVKSDSTMSINIERRFSFESNYATIGTLKNDSAFGFHPFSFIDDVSQSNALSATYRYKLEIRADTSYYLDSNYIVFSENCNSASNTNLGFSIYPNPITESTVTLTANLTKSIDATVLIYNTAGQKVYQERLQFPQGKTNSAILLKKIPAGFYFLHIIDQGKKIWSERFLKD